MNLREAAQQALEALEEAHPKPYNEDVRAHYEAITALRTALAEPEQEPVALETVYETIIHWDEGGGKRSRRELARRIVALYTHPPQRKPLTDEEILSDEVLRYYFGCNGGAGPVSQKGVKIIRAVERAHKIGGEE
jgi:hypothetical protein